MIILLKEMGFSLERVSELLNCDADPLKKAELMLIEKQKCIGHQIEVVRRLSQMDKTQIGFNLFDPTKVNTDLDLILKIF